MGCSIIAIVHVTAIHRQQSNSLRSLGLITIWCISGVFSSAHGLYRAALVQEFPPTLEVNATWGDRSGALSFQPTKGSFRGGGHQPTKAHIYPDNHNGGMV